MAEIKELHYEPDLKGNPLHNLGTGAADTDAATRGFAKARANHTGTQTASTISDLAAAVQATRLDQFAAPTAAVPLNGQKLTGVADGSATNDAVNYGQLLALREGRAFKDPVRVATTANITLSGTQTIDGVSVGTGDRVLAKNQTTASENGIYVVAAGAWARATDFDASAEIPSGLVVPVSEGATNLDKLFMLTTNAPITVGTTGLVFAVYGAGGGFDTAGAGLTSTGTTVDVVAGTGIVVNANDVAIDTALVSRRAWFAIAGDGATTDFTLTHNFGTRDVRVEVYRDGTPWDTVGVYVARDGTNSVVVKFSPAPANGVNFRAGVAT